VRSRLVALERFVRWCAERSLTRPQELTRSVLEAYQRHLYLYRKQDGKPLTIRTQQTMLTPLRGWCRWLSRERYVQYNAAAELVIDLHAKRALERIAACYGVTQRAMLERLLVQAEEAALRRAGKLPRGQADYYAGRLDLDI
jgi:integrase/recombinase XerD